MLVNKLLARKLWNAKKDFFCALGIANLKILCFFVFSLFPFFPLTSSSSEIYKIATWKISFKTSDFVRFPKTQKTKSGKRRASAEKGKMEVLCAMLERAHILFYFFSSMKEMMMMMCIASVFNESQNHFQSSGSIRASGCLGESF